MKFLILVLLVAAVSARPQGNFGGLNQPPAVNPTVQQTRVDEAEVKDPVEIEQTNAEEVVDPVDPVDPPAGNPDRRRRAEEDELTPDEEVAAPDAAVESGVQEAETPVVENNDKKKISKRQEDDQVDNPDKADAVSGQTAPAALAPVVVSNPAPVDNNKFKRQDEDPVDDDKDDKDKTPEPPVVAGIPPTAVVDPVPAAPTRFNKRQVQTYKDEDEAAEATADETPEAPVNEEEPVVRPDAEKPAKFRRQTEIKPEPVVPAKEEDPPAVIPNPEDAEVPADGDRKRRADEPEVGLTTEAPAPAPPAAVGQNSFRQSRQIQQFQQQQFNTPDENEAPLQQEGDVAPVEEEQQGVPQESRFQQQQFNQQQQQQDD